MALAIETTTEVCGVALADSSAIRCEAVVSAGLSHSSRLMELVRRVLADASVSLADLDVLAASTGPGSFTGIRIGLGAAIGLASGAGLPVVGVPTLDALAWRQRPFDGLVCPFVDARRGEVYFCMYECSQGGVRRVGDYSVGPPSQMIATISGSSQPGRREPGILLAGPVSLLEARGVEASEIAGLLAAPPERSYPGPGAVATLALERHAAGESGGPASLRPIYVRRSDAELKRK
jgi:tRNA threonylcarbamoyladenosine biosynthesis protein TsaB